MLIYSQLKAGVCKRVAASCPNSQTFLDQANAAVRQLMNRGDWWGTVQPMRFCLQGTSFVLPRFVASVLALNRCGSAMQMANLWYEFEHFDDWHRCAAKCCNAGQPWTAGPAAITNGTTNILNQIPQGDLNYVRFYATQTPDYGKTVTVYGLDSNGQVVFSQHPDGTIQQGIVLTLAQPYVQSTIQFSKIFRVVKDITAGIVRGYLYEPNQGLMNLLCEFYPNDICPDYIHMKLAGGGQSCCAHSQISALVKLQYIPMVFDNDIVLIDNEDAIRDMILSIRQKEAGNLQESAALELSAFRELNYQMRNRYPDEQFVVNFQPFGRASFNRVTNGFM